MDKNAMIFVIIIVLILLVAAGVMNYNQGITNETAIKRGLEECPNLRSNNKADTIWVKDCSKFMKDYNKVK